MVKQWARSLLRLVYDLLLFSTEEYNIIWLEYDLFSQILALVKYMIRTLYVVVRFPIPEID